MSIHPLQWRDPHHPQADACSRCEIRQTALFGVLGDADLDRIHTHIAGLTLAPDEPIYSRGSAGLAVYTVRSGVVRFERTTDQGDRRIVRLAGKGDLIGQEALLQRHHSDEAVCCTEVQLCRIPCTLVDDLGRAQGALLRELMLRWQVALDEAEAWLAELAAGPARLRLLRLLRRLADHADAAGQVWLPRREEIGAMLGLTEETASRLVSALRREGLVTVLPGRSARLDPQALDAALQVNNAD